MKQKIVWASLLFVLVAGKVNAQSITSSVLTITPNGGTALPPVAIALSSYVCNQVPPPPATNVINPSRIVVDDPNNAGMVCIYTDTGTGPLKTLPFGAAQYTATLMWTDSTGNSPESVPSSPFSHPGLVPTAPTGVKVIQ